MAKTELNINKLIDDTQTLIHDGKIEMASQGERQVQVIEFEDGSKYQLSVVMKFIEA